MAYSIAQKLKGTLHVDNLVLFGAPFRAHDGIGKIGHIWSFVSPNDKLYKMWQGATSVIYSDFTWDQENALRGIYNQTSNGTLCYTSGNNMSTDMFTDHINGYFDDNDNFNGFSCVGTKSQQLESRSKSGTRFDAHVDVIVDILEGRLK